MPHLSNDTLALQTMIESIDKIYLYSHSSKTADDFYHDTKSFDELWDIITNHLPTLKVSLAAILQNHDLS